VGYERLFAWWAPYLAANDEEGFVRELLDGQPDAHAYFGRMKRQNRLGPEVMGGRGALPELSPETVAEDLAADRITFVDTRSNADVHRGTAARSLNIPAGGKMATYGAWAYDPETDSRPLVLLAPNEEAAGRMWDALVRVGIDRVAGFTPTLEGLPQTTPKTLDPADLAGFDAALVLDVRNKTEHAAGHIPGSEQLSAGRVLWHTDQLPTEGVIVSYCQSGVRNSVAASALRRAGFDVVELEGSYLGWKAFSDAQEAAAAR
jgi:hydroxyacylglutathione hydrolase